MILALDIETIPNPEACALLPEPTAKKNLKDPAKIAADIAEKKESQVADAALDPLTGRVCCYAMVGAGEGEAEPTRYVETIEAATDDAERAIIQSIMRVLGNEDTRLVTWNGNNFDLPYIYKRAMILGVDPASFGAPPLTRWTKRYSCDCHFDLMQIWGGWSSQGYEKLDLVAGLVLGERKVEIDVATFPVLIETPEGREKLGTYCMWDTVLTWQLFQRMSGCLFV